jgi:multidrug efflux pump subunit AcrA (membrane-fusion protein)
MKRKILIILPIVILIVGFIAMRILINMKKEPPKRAAVVRPRMVAAEVVALKDIPSQITAYGRLMSAQPITLFSEVSGEIMRGSVPFQPAQSFKKGDLLLNIDDRQIKLEINTAKSDFLNAVASVLPELKVDFPEEYEKYQAYFDCCGFDEKLGELPETDNQKVKLYLSRFNVYKLYFAVRNLEIRLEKHYFYAPFSGSIVSADLRVGSTVRVGSQLGQIINLENLEVELPVPAIDIQWIDRSKPVTFTSSEIVGEWRGKIQRIGKNIDSRTQSVQVFASVDRGDQNGLYNGVFLKAQIPGTVIKNGISIPRKAIYEERFVYLIKNGKLDYREVVVSFQEPESIIATSGIANGDTLVVEVLQGVAPGMPAQARISEEVR